jgi:hypothetical protein
MDEQPMRFKTFVAPIQQVCVAVCGDPAQRSFIVVTDQGWGVTKLLLLMDAGRR